MGRGRGRGRMAKGSAMNDDDDYYDEDMVRNECMFNHCHVALHCVHPAAIQERGGGGGGGPAVPKMIPWGPKVRKEG